MTLLEKDIEDAFVEWCKTKGVKAYKLILHSRRGWPDRTCVLPGDRTVYVEFKKPGGKTSPQQDQCIAELRGQGAKVLVTDNLSAAKRFILSEMKR